MTDALHALNAQVHQRCGLPADQPLDAVALSLSTEFLARAAFEQPPLWGRLALISPTGLEGRTPRRAAIGSTRAVPWLHRLLSNPRWSQGLFNTLTRPGVIHYFLRRTFGSDNVDDRMWRYAVATARQPGARFAPLYFLSASLFSADIHTLYEALQQPVWVSHGVRGDFTDYRFKRLVDQRDNWHFTVFQAGAMPYFEQPAEFVTQLQDFLGVA
jgi:pimeloyl-ACP methyl ester carboxylesterase